MSVDVNFIKGKDKHIFAADRYPTGGLKLVPYSSNLSNVAVEGKEKVPTGQHIQLKIPMKEFGGRAHIVTFSAASAPKPDKSSKPFAKELIVPF